MLQSSVANEGDGSKLLLPPSHQMHGLAHDKDSTVCTASDGVLNDHHSPTDSGDKIPGSCHINRKTIIKSRRDMQKYANTIF